jgi:serine/threonine protein kinase
MAVLCPYCQQSMSVKSARAGRFTPKCGRCGRAFLLTISAGQGPVLSFTTAPMPGEESKGSFDPNVTAPTAAEVHVTAASKSSPGAGPAALGETQAPGTAGSDNPDFSLSPSLPDQTLAMRPASPSAAQRATDTTERDVSTAEHPAGEDDQQIPEVLGNYQVLKELGRGGMGAVYLARQASLNRLVALKVMNSRWASDPAFLVRFTREAYAAAQLVHHNVVQVYDIGADKGINYFSMEFVEGQSLGVLLKTRGPLGAAEAAGYALQAARGLKFAHDRGMVHRDIKPDNLMLNNQGIIKVADLGLVRTPGMEEQRQAAPAQDAAQRAFAAALAPWLASKGGQSGASLASLSGVTQAGQAMGTPTYMAPEQCRDATTIDHRADIYSLGCSLYVMVTGRPPFHGETALEIMTRHATEPVVPPDLVVKDLPRGLSDIILKMLAKKPEDRYADAGELIKALEQFLGMQGAGPMTATEEELAALERGVQAFRSSATVKVRQLALLGFFGGCAVLLLLFLVFRWWRLGAACAGTGVLTAAAYFVVQGVSERTHLFQKVRAFVLGARWIDYLQWSGGLLSLLVVWWLVGLLWVWLAVALLGSAIAVCLHYLLDSKIAGERARALDTVEGMLKRLRLRGVSEEALQEFGCQYSGEHWEEFFEALFGYEAKLAARARWGRGPRGPRPRFAAWRDPVVRWLERAQRARQEARQRKHLQAVEEKHLQAQGVSAGVAREQAQHIALAMVQKAAEIKKEAAPEALPVNQETPAEAPKSKSPPPPRVNVRSLFQVAEEPTKSTQRQRGRVLTGQLEGLFAGSLRFVLGALLLVGCLWWLHWRGLLPEAENVERLFNVGQLWEEAQAAEPLALPMIPAAVMKPLCSLSAGVMGLLLMLSAIWQSWKIGLLQYLALAVALAGPLFIPELGPLSPALASLAIGAGLSLLGFVFGRDT